MEFRSPSAAAENNANALKYLTKSLSDQEAGRLEVEAIISRLGNVIDSYPDWHPILTIPFEAHNKHFKSLSELYPRIDHTIEFVRGLVTCPYSEEDADKLVYSANQLRGLQAFKLDTPLYSDMAFPVVIEATEVELEADGTIRSRDALAWYTRELVKDARNAQVAETWWNMRSSILGMPHGSRSSLLVNQFTGSHMRKILEALNASGMYGPIKEWNLDMLSKKKRDKVGDTLIRAALTSHDGQDGEFEFELHGETCKAQVRDTWNDQTEFSVRVEIGDSDLIVSGYYYPEKDILESTGPKGKRALAEKFI